MSESKDGHPVYPGHSWGGLADNPNLQLGSRSATLRAIIKRIWLRNGGTEEIFDELFPKENYEPEDPEAPTLTPPPPP